MPKPVQATIDFHGRDFAFSVVDGNVRVSTVGFTSALAVFDVQDGEAAMTVAEIGDEAAMRAAAEVYALRSHMTLDDDEEDPDFDEDDDEAPTFG